MSIDIFSFVILDEILLHPVGDTLLIAYWRTDDRCWGTRLAMDAASTDSLTECMSTGVNNNALSADWNLYPALSGDFMMSIGFGWTRNRRFWIAIGPELYQFKFNEVRRAVAELIPLVVRARAIAAKGNVIELPRRRNKKRSVTRAP